MSTYNSLFIGLSQESGPGGFVAWWVWLIIIVIILIVVFLVWSMLKSDEEEVTVQTADEPEPAEPVTPDDLTKIEGVGPKINQLLQDAGFQTFGLLAKADVNEIDKLLDEAKLTFADASTWPDQAKLAADGDWDTLEKLQDNLKGGKR